MEKKMEKIKKELVKKNAAWGGLAACALAILGANSAGIFTARYADTKMADFMQGFYLGVVIVLEFFALYNLVRNYKSMKDDKALMRLYNEMHDERTLHIEAMAGMKGIALSMIVMFVLAIISSFFNAYIFIGLMIAIVVTGLSRKLCKLYYSKNYTGRI